MAASSVNINLSAKLDINLSFSVLLPSGQIVDVTGSSNMVALPALATENLDLAEANNASIEEVPMADEPISGLSEETESDSNVKGPLTEAMMRSLKDKWEALFRSPTVLPVSPSSLPMASSLSVSDVPSCLPMMVVPSSVTPDVPSSSVESPASPTFSSVDPNDLFWLPLPWGPLPCVGDDFDVSIIESVLEKDGELIVELDLGDKKVENDDDIIFLGEFKKV